MSDYISHCLAFAAGVPCGLLLAMLLRLPDYTRSNT